MKTIVIGAGIIGALTAYRLAQAGAEVTVIEAGQPGGAASGASFGWINASFHADEDHFNLRCAGIEAHHRLATDLQSDAASWPGCLCWEQEGAAFDAQHAALKALGYAVREVDRASFAEMEPAIAPPERALYLSNEGAVDLSQLAVEALRAASALGARWITGVRVTGFDVTAAQVSAVRTEVGVIPADRVVIAAGTATEALLQSVEVRLPMLYRPALILRSAPIAPLLRHVLVSPGQELRQTPQGALLAPTVAAHQSDASEEVAQSPDVIADQTMARVSAMLDRDLRWEQVTLAARPMPEDGLPVIGACGPAGLYVTTMHSGATLGALVAELAAAEIIETGLSNTQSALLAPYRPQRFTA